MKPRRSPPWFCTACGSCDSILGVVPLVIATGAGASARKSIGITVFSGMIASTCLAVLFVPPFFVVVQRFENWLAQRKRRKSDAPTISPAES